MSLNWNLSACPLHNDVLWDDDHTFITESLIWATLAVDLGTINEANVDEWLFRLSVMQTHSRVRNREEFGFVGCVNVVATSDDDPAVAATPRGQHTPDGRRVMGYADDVTAAVTYRLPTREELAKRFGLSTNVTSLSREAWMTQTMKHIREDAEGIAEQAVAASDILHATAPVSS